MRESALRHMPEELFKKEIGDQIEFASPPLPRETALLFTLEVKGQLMERKDVHVEERHPLLEHEQAREVPPELFGRHDDGNGSSGIVGLEGREVMDEGGFEKRMKRAGDDVQHAGGSS